MYNFTFNNSIEREEPEEVAPVFSQNLSPEILREGDRLKLTCSVKGTPDPDVEWYFNGQVSTDLKTRELGYTL